MSKNHSDSQSMKVDKTSPLHAYANDKVLEMTKDDKVARDTYLDYAAFSLA